MVLFYNFLFKFINIKRHNGGTAGDLVSKNGILRTDVHTLFCLVAKLFMLGKYNKKQKVLKCNA